MNATPRNKASNLVSSRSAVEDAIDAAKDFPDMTWEERSRLRLGHIPRWDQLQRGLPSPSEPENKD